MISIPPKGTPVINTCVQLFPQKALCEQEGGVWYGTDTTVSPVAYASCCALQNATGMDFTILPLSQAAVRNDRFKLIQVTNENCNASSAGNDTVSELQFYRINEAPLTPRIDYPRLNLITNPNNPTRGMTDKQAAAFVDLRRELSEILDSESQCPGDGNGDGIVNGLDIKNWAQFHNSGSSWYDFDLPITDGYDGLTNKDDRNHIYENLGRTCRPR